MYHGEYRNQSKWSILMASFWQQFLHSTTWSLAETNFTIYNVTSFGDEMSKKILQPSYDGFDTAI